MASVNIVYNVHKHWYLPQKKKKKKIIIVYKPTELYYMLKIQNIILKDQLLEHNLHLNHDKQDE